MEEEKICFINYIGEDSNGVNIYELLFTRDIDTFWFENAEYKPLGIINNIEVENDSYDIKRIVKTSLKLDLIQESTCFGFQDCIDNIVALAYENTDNYMEYPEDGRLVIHYGDGFKDIERKLANKNIIMEKVEY